jgi:hypothetical protein
MLLKVCQRCQTIQSCPDNYFDEDDECRQIVMSKQFEENNVSQCKGHFWRVTAKIGAGGAIIFMANP